MSKLLILIFEAVVLTAAAFGAVILLFTLIVVFIGAIDAARRKK